MRPVIALAAALAACAPPKGPAPQAPVTEQSLLLAQVQMRDDVDLVAVVQQRLQEEPRVPGRVLGQGWAGPNLYSVTFAGRCENNPALVTTMSAFLRRHGATKTGCKAAASFAPGEPASLDP